MSKSKKAVIILIICVAGILSSFFTWYFLYRETININNVQFEAHNENLSLVFTISNTEDRARDLRYRYEIIESKSGEKMAVGDGKISIAPYGEEKIESIPNVISPYERLFQIYREYNMSPTVDIKVFEDGRVVGRFHDKLPLYILPSATNTAYLAFCTKNNYAGAFEIITDDFRSTPQIISDNPEHPSNTYL